MSTPSPIRDALVVGICNYDELPLSRELNALVKKANELVILLNKQGNFRITPLPCTEKKIKLGSSEKTVLELCSGEVTKFDLEKAIERLFNPKDTSSLPDIALLFFVGHGLRKDIDKNTCEGYLAPSDADPKDYTNCLSLKWLCDQIHKSPIKRQIVFLEACYSGEFVKDFTVNSEKEVLFVTSARAHEESVSYRTINRCFTENPKLRTST